MTELASLLESVGNRLTEDNISEFTELFENMTHFSESLKGHEMTHKCSSKK
jgi:hypothetical protein